MKHSLITSAIIPGMVSNYIQAKRNRCKAEVSFSALEVLTVGAWERSTARAADFSASKLLYLFH